MKYKHPYGIIGLLAVVVVGVVSYWYYVSNYRNSWLNLGKNMQIDSILQPDMCEPLGKGTPFVEKKILANGMTILVRPIHFIPKVSLQIWYNVGSKDEEDGEKGIAHLIEHMIFKGTSGKDSLNLSESDINTLVHALSGTTNAFTAQDFTGYTFDMPTHTWREALPIMADCMVNVAFKDDHLNSEMKAVIQELKMRRDKYQLSLAEELLTTIFTDHPYHYPIIGYKQDLWNVHADNLRAFYKKHYWPNNATLVIVGDVNPQEVFELAEKYFGKIKPNYEYKRPKFYYNKDIVSKEVTLYRDIARPFEFVAFAVPGASAKRKAALDVLSLLLGQARGSRLYRKIVDELHLATSLSSFYWGTLFEHSVFFIAFEPNDIADMSRVESIIQEEIDTLIAQGVQPEELNRALKQARMNFYNTLEDIHEQASGIGKFYVATGDENFIYHYLDVSQECIQQEIHQLLIDYFRPSLMHKGKLLPLPEREKEVWQKMQKESDDEDTLFLSQRPRSTPVEIPVYAPTVIIPQASAFNFPKAQEFALPTGLKVLYYNNSNTPKISLELRFKAQGYYDHEGQQGLYNFMAEVMAEGTKNYTAAQLTDEFESRGMGLSISPGSISMNMLSSDLKKGLELLLEILTNATFPEHEIEKVRNQLISGIKSFWDNPSAFANQVIKEQLYKGHPYSKNSLGTVESIEKIRRQDLVNIYKEFISPKGTTLALVGDLQGYDVPSLVAQVLDSWKGPEVASLSFPPLTTHACTEINYPINRDQVLLALADLSVDRKNPDYDKLVLFDQILGGGVLGSMKSRLFSLREQSGLFYSISGSLTSHANEQPGMVLIKTLVSCDRLDEAEKAIKNTLTGAASAITDQELLEAKNALINSFALNFETNTSIAHAFLFLDKYGFSPDYFEMRIKRLEGTSKQEVQEAVARVLYPEQLCVFKIGRVECKPK